MKPLRNRKARLIRAARRRHGRIYLIRGNGEDFTFFDDDELIFWYNTEDGSTHIIREGAI